jgi:hypothetical protein
MTNGNDSAFPVTDTDYDMGIRRTEIIGGLTKREYFAGLAMQGIMANSDGIPFEDKKVIAKIAVAQADALLSALSGDTKGEIK